jgi:hypothetical protein
MEIPSDWKFSGAIARGADCHAVNPGIKFTAESKDGGTALVQLPGVRWTWTSNPTKQKSLQNSGCPVVELKTAADFLVNIAVPNVRPKGKVVAIGPLEEAGVAALAKQLEEMRQQNAAMAKQYGQKPQTLSLEGARVRVQSERDGHAIEELFIAVINCVESTMPGVWNQPPSQERSCNSRFTRILRAPQGKLDEFLKSAHLKTMDSSVVADAAWEKRVMQDQQAAFQQAQAQNNANFQRMMQNGRDQQDARTRNAKAFDANLRAGTDKALAADRARQQAIDDSAHKTAMHSLNQQEFINPSNGQKVVASDQYNHQWMSSDGSTVIQTNDHSYDPNGQVYINQSWTELVTK